MKENDKKNGIRMRTVKVTDINNDEKDEFNPLQIQSGNTEWKKGERPRILPLGSMASTSQIHFPFKSRDLSGYKRYMEDNINEGIHPEDGA